MSGCLEDVSVVEAFLHENISANILSAEDNVTLGS